MRAAHFLLPVLLLSGFSASSPAQTGTSPKGLLNAQGNNMFFHWGGTRRFQQVDATQQGAPMVLQGIAFRRAAGGGGGSAVPRTMDLEVKVGHGDLGVVTLAFDANFSGAPHVAFTNKTVNFPDWTGVAGPPAPFDFRAPFDNPFIYIGQGALVIDFVHQNTSVSGLAQTDRDASLPVGGISTILGTGCVPSGQNATFSHTATMQNNGPPAPNYGMRLLAAGTAARANTPVLLLVGASDPDLPVPGLCTNLRTMPLLTLNMGISTATGAVTGVYFSFPHSPAMVGGALHTQLLALDPGRPGIPAILSNGRRAVVPSSTATHGHDCVYGWTAGVGPNGSFFFGGGMVIGLF